MAPKYRKIVMCLMEKILVLDELYSGMSYTTIGHEFKVNQYIRYIKSVYKNNINIKVGTSSHFLDEEMKL